MVGCNSDGPPREHVLRFMEEKERIEREIREAKAILETNNVGMDEPLVDQEGFPRNDIDVYKVRHARHQIICLKNDHKNIMKAIEQGLAAVHADLVGPSGADGGPSRRPVMTNTNGHSALFNQVNGSDISDDLPLHQHSFATVGVVQEGSPAEEAGLRENDEILEFGSINYRNFNDISQVNDLVSHSVNHAIQVQVRRGRRLVNMALMPRPWAQPGLLGCHIQRT